MSSTSSPTLIPDVSARRSEAVVATLTIVAGCAGPFLIDGLAFGDALLLGVAIGALIAWGFVRAGWLGSANRIQTVVWEADGRWVLTDARGRHFDAALDDASRVWPQTIWLRWRTTEGLFSRRSMLLTRLDLTHSDVRRLVVRLRLDRLEQAPTPGVAAV